LESPVDVSIRGNELLHRLESLVQFSDAERRHFAAGHVNMRPCSEEGSAAARMAAYHIVEAADNRKKKTVDMDKTPCLFNTETM
jgi:hypothetical protein